jgi:hypothetical protein
VTPKRAVYEVVYYESIKRKLKIKPIYECRCDERLQIKTKRFPHLSYTGLVVELEQRLFMEPVLFIVVVSYVVYYETIKRELKIRGIYECRCDERLQTKTKEFKLLAYNI